MQGEIRCGTHALEAPWVRERRQLTVDGASPVATQVHIILQQLYKVGLHLTLSWKPREGM